MSKNSITNVSQKLQAWLMGHGLCTTETCKDVSTDSNVELNTLEDRILYSAVPFIAEPAEPVEIMEIANTFEVFDSVESGLENIEAYLTESNQVDYSLDSLDTSGDGATTELFVIDQSLSNSDELVADALAQSSDARQIEVRYLNPDSDGLAQLTEILGSYSNLSALHLVTHGGDGELTVGATVLNSQTLSEQSETIISWRSSFTADADFLIYGCDLAETESGESFIDQISTLTGTDVAASDDLTGHTALGGDWTLEYVTGDVDTGIAFSTELQASWLNTLPAAPTMGIGDVTDSVNQDLHALNRGSMHSVAMDAAGNFVVVWSEFDLATNWDVKAQRFDDQGNTVGSSFTVNATVSDIQDGASVAMDDAGNFVVTWTSENQDGDAFNVYSRYLSWDLTVDSGEMRVNDTTGSFYGQNSTVAMNASGQYVIAWQGEGAADSTGVYATLFDIDQSVISADIAVNAVTTGTQENVDVSINDAGEFAVAWNDGDGAYFHRFGNTGNAVLAQAGTLNTTVVVVGFPITTYHYDAAIHIGNDDQIAFVVTTTVGGNDAIDLIIVDETNTELANIDVNQTTAADQKQATVDRGSDGNYIVTFAGRGDQTDNVDSDGVFLRKFDSSGTAISDELRINDYTTGTQEFASIAVEDADNYVAVWSGEGTSDSQGVFVSLVQAAVPNSAPTATGGTIIATENLELSLNPRGLRLWRHR